LPDRRDFTYGTFVSWNPDEEIPYLSSAEKIEGANYEQFKRIGFLLFVLGVIAGGGVDMELKK
jgi:hypothetical protein